VDLPRVRLLGDGHEMAAAGAGVVRQPEAAAAQGAVRAVAEGRVGRELAGLFRVRKLSACGYGTDVPRSRKLPACGLVPGAQAVSLRLRDKRG